MPAEATQPVEREVRSALLRLGLLQEPARLAVAYSGGQDSTCLLAATMRVLPRAAIVSAVHVDHGILASSAQQAEQVVQNARQIGAPAESVRVDVPAFRRLLREGADARAEGRSRAPRRPSLQQAARIARYWALAAACTRLQADALLVAHTADDQAETVLLRLLRGTGLAGLAGMREQELLEAPDLGPRPPALGNASVPGAMRVVRPLLNVERAATAAYCAAAGLQVVDDASNRTRIYTRNQVRLDLLPVLEQISPSVRTVLARTARLAADDEAALDALARGTFAEHADVQPDAVAFQRREWQSLPRALRRRLLRRAVEQLAGTLRDVPFEPVEGALDLLERPGSGRTHHLPWDLEVCTGRDHVVVRRRSASVSQASGEPRL